MKFQAIITDLDGTALDSPQQKTASERLAQAVEALEAKGIKVCAATGRAEIYAEPLFVTMKLRQPAIISGGTRIIDPVSRAELWRCGMNGEQLRAVTDVLRNASYGFLWNDYSEADYLEGGWPLEQFTDYDSTYFFEICFVPQADVQAIVSSLSKIPGLTVTVFVSQGEEDLNDIHVTNSEATKEHAVYQLESIIGVPKQAMIGVGDGPNDLHLFAAVGHKVAMANAVPEVKTAADEVIGSVQADGLAEYFERLARELA